MESSRCREVGSINCNVVSIPLVDLEKRVQSSSDSNGTESSDFVIEETAEKVTSNREETSGLSTWPHSSFNQIPRSIKSPTKVLPKRVDSKKGRKYICKQCDYATTSYSNITNHFKYLHPRLSKNGNLFRHYRTIVNAQGFKRVPVMYFCQHCNYITLNLRGFMLHSSRIHPKRKVNPFKQGTPITTMANRKYLEALCLSKEEPEKSKKKAHRLLKAYHPDSQLFFNHPKYLSVLPDPLSIEHNHEKSLSQRRPRRETSSRTLNCKICSHFSNSHVALHEHYVRHCLDDAIPMLESTYTTEVQNNDDEMITCYNGDSTFDILEKPEGIALSLFHGRSQIPVAETRGASCSIPCVVCDFSAENLPLLLEHYHNHHEGCYPKGFQSFLEAKLRSQMKTILVHPSEAIYIDEKQATWMTDNNQLIQYCEYSCELCEFKSDWFSPMFNHVASKHVATAMSPLKFIDKKPSILPNLSFTSFLQCSLCCHVEFTRMNMVIHYKNVHMEACQSMELDDAYSMSEKRRCKDCDYTGNYDTLQWHCIENHGYADVRWSSLEKVDSFAFIELQCCRCQYMPSDDADLISHYQKQHFKEVCNFSYSAADNCYRCLSCGFEMLTLACFATHSNFCTKNSDSDNSDKRLRYPACKLCLKVFDKCTTELVIWNHIIKEHHINSLPFTIDDLPPYTLKYGHWDAGNVLKADRLTKSKFSLQKVHQGVKHVSNDKTIALKKGTARKTLKCHSTVKNFIKCKFCFASVMTESELIKHLSDAHRLALRLRCFGCDEHFSSAVECKNHHQQLHGIVLDHRTIFHFLLDDVAPSDGREEKFSCAWCGFYNFSNLIVLNHFNSSHVTNSKRKRRHFKNGSYSCRWCEYTTKNITSMRAHINSKHGKVISYHSLGNFTSDDPNTSESRDSSDSDYHPSKELKRTSSRAKKHTRKCFTFTQLCKMDDEDEFSDPEVYKTTHNRHKHRNRYPYVCSFCKTCYLCTTAFLIHCKTQHKDLCFFHHVKKHAVCLPEPALIPHLQQKLNSLHDFNCTESVFYGNAWPCVLCSSASTSLQKLQEHIFYSHNGKKVFMCKYCNFLAAHSKEIIVHVQCHTIAKEVRSEDCGLNSSNSVARLSKDLVVDIRVTNSQEKPASLVKRPSARKSIRSTSHQFDATNLKILKITSNSPENLSDYYSEYFNVDHEVFKCRKCQFSCGDTSRAREHVDTEHAPSESFSCKFCYYTCTDRASLDSHLANFHKIEKNHQLGLLVRANGPNELTIAEPSTALIKQPTRKPPPLPSLDDDVIYIESDDDDVKICKEEPVVVSDLVANSMVEPISLQCPYCGYKSPSTLHHKNHMERHKI